MSNDKVVLVENPEVVELSGSVIWSYYKDVGAQRNLGRAKNVTCSFCDAAFTGCSSRQAYAHILVRNVLGQKKMNIMIKACVPIIKPVYQ